MSPDSVWLGLFLPCSLPQLLPAAAGGGLEPAPVSRFRGASPHRLLSYAKESSVADSFAHGTLRRPARRMGWQKMEHPLSEAIYGSGGTAEPGPGGFRDRMG